jgi:hypothetical protein
LFPVRASCAPKGHASSFLARTRTVAENKNSDMRTLISLLLMLALSMLAGCGGGRILPQPSGNAQLTVSPAALSFGSIGVGNSKTLVGTLKAARGAVNISTAEWSGSGYALSGISFPVSIPQGHSIPFQVTFTPSGSGAANGRLSFITDAIVSPSSQTLNGSGAMHLISLSWQASSSPVIGYNVYRGTQSGGPYSRVNALPISAHTYNDEEVQSGLTYFYVLRAVGSDSIESPASNQAVAAVP